MEKVPLTAPPELDEITNSGHHYAIGHHQLGVKVSPGRDHAKANDSAGKLLDGGPVTVQEVLSTF